LALTTTGRLLVRRTFGFAVELDRERVLGDVEGHGAAGVDAPERHGLAADDDHAAEAALYGDGLGPCPGWRSGRAPALQASGLGARESGWGGRAAARACRVQEHQRGALDRKEDGAPAEGSLAASTWCGRAR
jgi:hypothetical protein